MAQLCLIKNSSTNMYMEVEAEHMVLKKTKCEEFLCTCTECVAAWLSKHCNTKKTPSAGKQCYLHFEM